MGNESRHGRTKQADSSQASIRREAGLISAEGAVLLGTGVGGSFCSQWLYPFARLAILTSYSIWLFPVPSCKSLTEL